MGDTLLATDIRRIADEMRRREMTRQEYEEFLLFREIEVRLARQYGGLSHARTY
jgi:hypothetical protein